MTRAVLLVLLASVPAIADDRKDWQRAQREIDRDEKKFWADFRSRFNDASMRFEKPVQQAYENPDRHKEATYDFAPIDRLYADAREFGLRRGRADAQLDVGDPKSRVLLLKALLDEAKVADRMDENLADDVPDFGRYTYDQESGCRLEAIEARLGLLLPALGRAPLEFLTTDAWKKCARGDGRKSTRRRLALIDALASRADGAALEFLRERFSGKTRAVRVAAAEAMVACGIDTRGLLADEDPVVRRAVLLAWGASAKPEWFGAVLEHAGRCRGFERDLAVRLLARWSNQPFGHDLDGWRKWYEDYKKELEGGRFDVKNVEVAEAKPAPDPEAFRFYGIPVSSTSAVFAVDASSHLAMPADLDFQRTRWRGEWRGLRREWETEHVAHETVLSREFERAFASFPKDFRWGMVTLFGRLAMKAVGEKRLLGDRDGDRKAALKLLDQAPEKGWCAPLAGLLYAARLGGDGIDTVVLWHNGDPFCGRYVGALPSARAWRRFNRARKLQVIAIRISNRGDAAEAFMRRVAEESGGRYLWAKKPPNPGD